MKKIEKKTARSLLAANTAKLSNFSGLNRASWNHNTHKWEVDDFYTWINRTEVLYFHKYRGSVGTEKERVNLWLIKFTSGDTMTIKCTEDDCFRLLTY